MKEREEAIRVKPKAIVKICVDIGMTVALLLLMTYELVGQAAHEWLGIGMSLHLGLHWSMMMGLCKAGYCRLYVFENPVCIL